MFHTFLVCQSGALLYSSAIFATLQLPAGCRCRPGLFNAGSNNNLHDDLENLPAVGRGQIFIEN